IPRVKGIAPAQIRSAIAAADGHDHAAVVVLGRLGLRCGELLGLLWSDLDLEHARVRVERSLVNGETVPPKSGKPRALPMSRQTVAALRKQRDRVAKGERRVFPELHTRDCVQTMLIRVCKAAGMRRVGPHAFRHGWATHCVLRGVPLTTLQ